NRTAPTVAGPLSQRGYLWQRDWTVAVNSTVLEAQKRMDGVILLGGEISWIAGNPEVVRTNINWQTLALSGVSCGIALRIARYPGPLPSDDTTTEFIVGVAKSLINVAASHGVILSEFQIDFDCTPKNLGAYRGWLRSV